MSDRLVVAAAIGGIGSIAIAYYFLNMWLYDRRAQRAQRLAIVRARLLGSSPPENIGAEMVRTKSVWSYIEGKLFPTKWWPVKDHETRTFLRTQIDCRLSGADRLRLILTGCIRIYVTTYTDVEVHDAESLSNLEVHPFKEGYPPITRKFN